MSWTLILVQEKGYISKRLLAFMWILTAEPTPRTPVSARPLLLYQKVKSGRQNYKTEKHQHVSLYLQWGTSWPSPHTSDLAGSVVNTTKMGTTLFSSSDLQMSVTDQVILKKSFYLRKKKKKSDSRHIFSSSWARKKKGSPYTEVKSRTPAPRLVAEEQWNHS